MTGESPTAPSDIEWLPEAYDPDAPLRERLPILAEIEGGIELHVRGESGTVEVVGRPKVCNTGGDGGYMELLAGGGPRDDVWGWEIVIPRAGPPFLRKADPNQPHEAYMATRRRWLEDIDVRIYGVDADRFAAGGGA